MGRQHNDRIEVGARRTMPPPDECRAMSTSEWDTGGGTAIRHGDLLAALTEHRKEASEWLYLTN